MECQHRGGTCEFFLGCWLSGGLIQGTCDGLLRGCCHRTAKSANLRSSDYVGNTVDLTDLPQKNYGPVNNEPSESGGSRLSKSEKKPKTKFAQCTCTLKPTTTTRTTTQYIPKKGSSLPEGSHNRMRHDELSFGMSKIDALADG